MTREEAIQEIINLANNLQIIPSTSTGQAVLMAIKCIEALDKIKVEMQEQYKTFANISSISDVWADAIDIIDKHLAEVGNYT